jgi:hypothetical protein
MRENLSSTQGENETREMTMNDKSIFISVGHLLSPNQLACLGCIRQILIDRQMRIVSIERKAQMLDDPIRAIRHAIDETNGTIILAFIRYVIPEIIEFPWVDEQKPMHGRRLPTVWNQIEGAMSLQASRPLLIICEKGLSYEGILDPVISPIIEIDLNDPYLDARKMLTPVFSEWVKRLN